MTTVSGDLWPYVLMTLGWLAVFVYLLIRVIKGGPAMRSPIEDAASARPSSHQAVDTQAGRI